MNKNSLLLVNILLVIFDIFVGLHLLFGLWGNILLNNATELYSPAIITTLILIAVNVVAVKYNRRVKQRDNINANTAC